MALSSTGQQSKSKKGELARQETLGKGISYAKKGPGQASHPRVL
jgi:hypothetical protein